METAQVIAKSEAVKSSSGRFYRPELDALRFLAFSLVFLYHSTSVAGGRHGVQVFFVLSAFLITELLLRERDRTGNVNISAFYIRRGLRIWPLYFTMLMLCFVFTLLVHYPRPAIEWLSYLVITGNLYTAFSGHYLPWGWMVLWTITVEEQFYLLWPTLIKLGGRRGIVLISSVIWVVGQIACVSIAIHVGSQVYAARLWTDSLVNFQYFAVGAILAVFLHDKKVALPGWARILLLIFGLLTFQLSSIGSWLHLQGTQMTVLAYLVYLATGVGAACILIAAIGFHVPVRLQWAIHLGKISYGLYVFHEIFVLLAGDIGAAVFHIHHLATVKMYWLSIPLTLLTASLSYRYLETPFLRLKGRFEIVKSRPV